MSTRATGAMRRLVDQFTHRQRSERTAKTYGGVAHAFLASFPATRSPTRQDVEHFLARPLRSGARSSEAAYNQTLAALRAFAKFAVAEGAWTEDPTGSLRFLREPERDPPVLGISEVHAFLRAVSNVSPTEERERDRAILALFFTSGLRASELVRLNVEQTDLETGTLLSVTRKGRRVQDLPLQSGAVHLVRAWLHQRVGAARPGEPALLVSRRGSRISVRTVQRLFARLRKHVGTPKHVTPHTARHSFITLELAAGAELSVVSRLAGHASVTTTMRYRHLLDGEARRAVSLLEPLIPRELLALTSTPVDRSTNISANSPPRVLDAERMTIPPANDTLDAQENLDAGGGKGR